MLVVWDSALPGHLDEVYLRSVDWKDVREISTEYTDALLYIPITTDIYQRSEMHVPSITTVLYRLTRRSRKPDWYLDSRDWEV